MNLEDIINWKTLETVIPPYQPHRHLPFCEAVRKHRHNTSNCFQLFSLTTLKLHLIQAKRSNDWILQLPHITSSTALALLPNFRKSDVIIC
jgi:hypothetical protein